MNEMELQPKKKILAEQVDQEMSDAEEDPEERVIEMSDGEVLWIVPEEEDKPAFNTRSRSRKVICAKAIRDFV